MGVDLYFGYRQADNGLAFFSPTIDLGKFSQFVKLASSGSITDEQIRGFVAVEKAWTDSRTKSYDEQDAAWEVYRDHPVRQFTSWPRAYEFLDHFEVEGENAECGHDFDKNHIVWALWHCGYSSMAAEVVECVYWG